MAQGDRADRLLAVMVDHLVAAGLVKRHGAVPTDSTHVRAAVRKLNRAELVTETPRAALEQLALADEHWLAPLITADWADRYGRPAIYHRLPKGKAALEEYALQVGTDGMRLLRAVFSDQAAPRLRTLPQVEILRRVVGAAVLVRQLGAAAVAGTEVHQGPVEQVQYATQSCFASRGGGKAGPGESQCPVGQHGDHLPL
jgi:hypothetical protein